MSSVKKVYRRYAAKITHHCLLISTAWIICPTGVCSMVVVNGRNPALQQEKEIVVRGNRSNYNNELKEAVILNRTRFADVTPQFYWVETPTNADFYYDSVVALKRINLHINYSIDNRTYRDEYKITRIPTDKISSQRTLPDLSKNLKEMLLFH